MEPAKTTSAVSGARYGAKPRETLYAPKAIPRGR